MKKFDQSGIALLETLLVLIIIAAIAGTGWYVWQSKQETDSALKASNSAANSTMKSSPNSEASKYTTLYTTPGKEYSVELPNGWQLERNMNDPNLFQFDIEQLKLDKGVKAVVKPIEGGKDGTAIGFSLWYAANGELNGSKPEGDIVVETKTDAGDTLVVRKFTQTKDVEGLGALPKGATEYIYRVLHGDEVIEASYGFDTADEDIHDTVTDSIKSIKFL